MNTLENIKFVISEACKTFTAITLSGFFNSENQTYTVENQSRDLGISEEDLLSFCKQNLKPGNSDKSTINLEFARKGCLIFQYAGEDWWVILGGADLLSYQVQLFLKKLWVLKDVLKQLEEHEEKEDQEKKIEVEKQQSSSGNTAKNKSYIAEEHFPEVWQSLSDATIDYENDDILFNSAYRLRRKQFLSLYKDFKTAGFDNIFANYFILSNISINQTKNFYWYKKLGTLHYFFFVKSNSPKLDLVINYASLSTFINNIEKNSKQNSQKLYNEITELTNGFELSFDEEESANKPEDYIGVFCLDEYTNKIEYTCQGFYFSSITANSKNPSFSKFESNSNFHHAEYELKKGEKHFLFSEEIFDLYEGSLNEKKEAFKKQLSTYTNDTNITKSTIENNLKKTQEKSKITPDFLLCYIEMN